MMFQHLYIAVAFLALVFTFAATHPLWDRETQTIWAAVAMVAWGIWGSQAGSIAVVDNGETFTETHVSLLVLGWLLAFIMFVFIVVNVLRFIREG